MGSQSQSDSSQLTSLIVSFLLLILLKHKVAADDLSPAHAESLETSFVFQQVSNVFIAETWIVVLMFEIL